MWSYQILLPQDELEVHSEPESISIFVHYGGDRTNNPDVLSGYDVVLTTYGVLTSAYKTVSSYLYAILNFIVHVDNDELLLSNGVHSSICLMAHSLLMQDGECSIYHRVDWYRVVLDEAHTIKSSKTQSAQAAFTLNSYCRWCLTGTPLQVHIANFFSSILLITSYLEICGCWSKWYSLPFICCV